MPTRRPVGSTYRVQVRPQFDLDATAELAGYLADLGVTHLYTAPILTATPGSEHGYDVVDHRAVNPELGGEAARRRLVAALGRAGLGLVVDIVPNHMGVAVPHANHAWWAVLQHGPASPYAHWFDIDWRRPRITIPVLGSDSLDDLRVEDGELRYYDHRYPIAEGTGDGTPQQVHDRQHYELINWRRGDTELNYRRFFAIVDLAGLRVEDETVFEGTHREILRWVAAGEVDGIRVDHPDGLRDPRQYLVRLRAAAPDTWLVIEKILEPGEDLDPQWPVDGTTGYDALREIGGVFIDPAGESGFPAARSWAEVAHEQKLDVTRRLFQAELNRMDPDHKAELGALAARFEVYRTYLPAGAEHLDAVLAQVDPADALAQRLRTPQDELAQRFQQLTGAVMAKGVEDTAMYQWNRFVALNEVGGDPSRFGVSLEEFHSSAAARHRRWPASMTTLATHDTKRGEDVRARLAVLAERPGEWAETVARWKRAAPIADESLADLLWQTVAGAWPIERDRLHAYVVKAAREANLSTSWTDPDEAFEKSIEAAVDEIYRGDLKREITAFADTLTPFGWSNSLGQKLLQLMAPGVPDTYQGTELWDNSLVDPDNRRPVDFAARRALLQRLDDGWLPPVDAGGAAKLLVVSRALRVRRDRPLPSYEPVRATGPAAEHVVAFDRGGVIAVATRLPVKLARQGWGDTTLALPPGDWTDALTGTEASPRLTELLERYPVALLVQR
jgi:(1->4)-alpha-D-glucan 1-alpha-D-glucosylmutase